MKAIDRLMNGIREKQNPTVFGLDTRYEYLPEQGPLGTDWQREAAERIWQYNKTLLEALKDIVPAVKVQIAYYEMYGLWGMELFQKSCAYAKELGYFLIVDAKRGDIGPTAGAYAAAFLGQPEIEGKAFDAFPCDMLTVNPYLGSDGIKPFVDACAKYGKGIFVLVKTSNPSSGEFQDIVFDGKTLYERVAEMVELWGKDLIGQEGYSDVGAVVGATYPRQGQELRAKHKSLFFLVPGYGAQGATASDLAGCFDEKGGGALVNASRSLLCAHQKYPDMGLVESTRKAALDMKEDLLAALGGKIS